MKRTQVNKNHYFSREYDDHLRFNSYYIQKELIIGLKPKKILEIGIGNSFLADYLRKRGYNVLTYDIDKSLNPDIFGDIRSLKFENNTFDLIVAFEVVEHLKFREFINILSELKRVTNKYVIISVPYETVKIYGYLKIIPKIRPINILVKISEKFFIENKFNGQHYWEMGKKGTSLKIVKGCIKSCKLKIKYEYFSYLNPYHYFFVLKK